MANLLNENIIKGKWNELKGQIRQVWGNLTDDEVDTAHGDLNKFYGSIQQKYGQSQEEVRHKLNNLVYPDDKPASNEVPPRAN